MKFWLSLGLVSVFASCTTSEHVPDKLDTSLKSKGKTEDGTIGLNKDGEAVVQEERAAQDELRIQENTNAVLRAGLDRDHYELKSCVKEMADPRLGGSGNLPEIPDLDNLKNPAEQKEEFGADDKGDLKVVRKTYFRDKLKAERSYEKSIKEMQKLVNKQLEKCKFEMAHARTKAGLPAKKAMAEGYFAPDGTWVETRKGERDLDDAYEHQAKSKAKAAKKTEAAAE